ncbi:Pyridine nucleotide-disulphide oxidoreductase [Caldanaerobius fijiensis DSM 17918]|uniref:Pyridine nucleotide-disulphide oxidoreductase n=1 Tax=Caldanaerobius fijiensis DSM 17918 TaxID=1121256 RepID=A0A1M4VMT7_9THEO|nr:FAD-dependent oxidoreductase [Caldanaerobius fijiensis]SHE70354.1 Pyridine nucleotide-disulphide oxidoreductase [Caldanaerobius fijiensis DSM 17918]
MRYVIIGNSAAAVGAVESIRKYDKDNEIVIISDEPYHVYSRPLISYYLGNKVDEDRMAYRERDFYQKNNVTPILGRKAVKINTQYKTVLLEDGREIEFSKLLIATGGKPFVPPMKGLEKKNIHTFIKMDDAKKLKNSVKPGSNVVVVGGGLIGFKAAEGLRDLGINVTVVELADRVLSAILDTQGGMMVQKRLEHFGIKIITQNTVEEILGDEYVSGVVLKDGTKLECDNLIIAIGVVPNTDVVKESEITVNRGIVVDRHMMTNVEGIYAAGDVAEAYDMLYEQNRVIPIWPNAYMQGEVAGANMTGNEMVYDGSFAMNSIGFEDVHMITAGIINPPSDEFEVLVKKDEDKTVYKKLVLKDNRIVGFIKIGEVDRAGIYTNLMKEKVDVSPFKDKLLEDDFGYVYLPKQYRKAKMLGEVVSA